MQIAPIKTPPLELQPENAATQQLENYTEKITEYITNYNKALQENTDPEEYTEQLYTQAYTNQLKQFIHRNWTSVLGHVLASEPEWYPEIHPSTTTDPDDLNTKFPLPVRNTSFTVDSTKENLVIAVYLHGMNAPLTFTTNNSYFTDTDKYITIEQLTYQPEKRTFQAKLFLHKNNENTEDRSPQHFPDPPTTKKEAIDTLEDILDASNFLTLTLLLEKDRDTIYLPNQIPIKPKLQQALEYIRPNIKLIENQTGLWITTDTHTATTLQIDIHTTMDTNLYNDHLGYVPAATLNKETAQTKRLNLRRELVSLLNNNIIDREIISFLTLPQYIPDPTYKHIMKTIQKGKHIESIADQFDNKHNCTHARNAKEVLKNRFQDSIKPQPQPL